VIFLYRKKVKSSKVHCLLGRLVLSKAVFSCGLFFFMVFETCSTISVRIGSRACRSDFRITGKVGE